MQVAESIESLAHDKSSLSFSKVFLLSDEEEKFTTFTEPRDEIKISLAFKLVSLSWKTISKNNKIFFLLSDEEADSIGFPSLMQLDDIWMVLNK